MSDALVSAVATHHVFVLTNERGFDICSVQAGEAIRRDADALEQQFLARQAQHKVKTTKLEKLMQQRRELEAELEQWKIEQSEMVKTTSMLSAQRDMKARDLSKVCVRAMPLSCWTHFTAALPSCEPWLMVCDLWTGVIGTQKSAERNPHQKPAHCRGKEAGSFV